MATRRVDRPQQDRGTETRAKVVDAALALLREEGYEATTMRRVAQTAGVSLGNAYYYLDGKDALVQELYLVVQEEHRALAGPRLRSGASLAENWGTALHAGLDVMAPYHRFGTTFVTVALLPRSPASPFSAASGRARELAVGLMADVVACSRPAPPPRMREALPRLLWLAYLGVTLHWVLDGSPGQRHTRRLVDGLTPLLGRALRLSRLPVGRALVDDLLRILEDATPSAVTSGPPAVKA